LVGHADRGSHDTGGRARRRGVDRQRDGHAHAPSRPAAPVPPLDPDEDPLAAGQLSGGKSRRLHRRAHPHGQRRKHLRADAERDPPRSDRQRAGLCGPVRDRQRPEQRLGRAWRLPVSFSWAALQCASVGEDAALVAPAPSAQQAAIRPRPLMTSLKHRLAGFSPGRRVVRAPQPGSDPSSPKQRARREKCWPSGRGKKGRTTHFCVSIPRQPGSDSGCW
jgi:hypothetical protein